MKRRSRAVGSGASVLIALGVVAAACASTGTSSNPSNAVVSSEDGDGRVVLFDAQLASYAESAGDMALGQRRDQFQAAVGAPMIETCVGDGEFAELAIPLVEAPIIDVEAARTALNDFDGAGMMDLLTAELGALQQALPGPPVTVCVVFAGDDLTDFVVGQMNGVTGVSPGAGRVVLIVAPSASDVALRYTLAHEYHHSWWASQQTGPATFTLLDYVVFEGRADAFAQLQYPDARAPWTDRLTPEQTRQQWVAIQSEIDSQDPDLLQTVMFGGGSYPQWTGYAIGSAILDGFVAASPDAMVADWSLMASTDVLAESGYADL